jgi:cell division protein FtsB
MESEIDLLRQENARLVAKNYELEAEIAKLRQIIEENARRDARVEELEQKNKELEARLAILEQNSLVTLQNDKETIAEVLPEIAVSDVDLSNAIVDQQNNVDARTSEKKEMDAFLVEVKALVIKLERRGEKRRFRIR